MLEVEEYTFNLIKDYSQEHDNWSLDKGQNLVVPTKGKVHEEYGLINQKGLL